MYGNHYNIGTLDKPIENKISTQKQLNESITILNISTDLTYLTIICSVVTCILIHNINTYFLKYYHNMYYNLELFTHI